MKNLVSKPATRRYPFADKREPPAGFRGKIRFDAAKCDQCGDCERACPAGAIQVQTQPKQTLYDPFSCIYCGTCVDTCLQQAITQDIHYTPPATTKQTETTKTG